MASNSGCESPAVVTVVDRLQRQESSGGVKIFGLSPVSEIAVNLQEATLDTPKGPTRRVTGGRALGKVIPSIFRSQLEAAEPVHNGSNAAAAASDNDDDDETDSDGDSGGFSDQQVEPDSKDDDKR
ncbi:hypothetical protein quinque_012299 [Culex quinquefasciatus]